MFLESHCHYLLPQAALVFLTQECIICNSNFDNHYFQPNKKTDEWTKCRKMLQLVTRLHFRRDQYLSSCSVVRIHNIRAEFDILLYEIYATLGHWIIHISSALNSRTPLEAAGPELIFLLGRQTSQYHLDYRRLNISYYIGLMTYSSAGMALLNIGQHDT